MPRNASNAILENIERLMHTTSNTRRTAYAARDVILYNLAVGAKREELDFVYEHAPEFQAIPTFACVPGFEPEMIYRLEDLFQVSKPAHYLLGELYTEICETPIPTSSRTETTEKLIGVLDKGSAAAATVEVTTIDVDRGTKLFYNEWTFFLRTGGGFGGERDSPFPSAFSKLYTLPTGKPHSTATYKTSEELAALYRLAGDTIPIHIDPESSKQGGWPSPILHGTCSFGIAGKHVFQRYGFYNKIGAQFKGPVLPGQTLQTHMWRSSTNSDIIVFHITVVETGRLSVIGAASLKSLSSSKPHL